MIRLMKRLLVALAVSLVLVPLALMLTPIWPANAPNLIRFQQEGPFYMAFTETVLDESGNTTGLVFHVPARGEVTIGTHSAMDVIIGMGTYDEFLQSVANEVQEQISTPEGYRLMQEGAIYVHAPIKLHDCTINWLDQLSCDTYGIYTVVVSSPSETSLEFSLYGPGSPPITQTDVITETAYSYSYAQSYIARKAVEVLKTSDKDIYVTNDIPLPDGCVIAEDRRFTCMQVEFTNHI